MKTLKVPRSQHPVLQSLTRKDIAVIRKYPKILAETKSVIRAFKSVKKVGWHPRARKQAETQDCSKAGYSHLQKNSRTN